MSQSSFSDVTIKSSIKLSQSMASGDGQQPQQQALAIGTQFDANTMLFSASSGGRSTGRRTSKLKHGRRSAMARRRSQAQYKSSSYQIMDSPYLNFLRDYRFHFGDRFQGQTLLQRATVKWRNMTQNEQALYKPNAYQRGKFTTLVEKDLDNMKPSAAKTTVYADTAPEESCPGVVCPMRPPKRSCRPKVTCKKRKPACRKPRKKACRRPRKTCKPRKRACRPKKPACPKRRKPACRPKPRCRPKKPSCRPC